MTLVTVKCHGNVFHKACVYIKHSINTDFHLSFGEHLKKKNNNSGVNRKTRAKNTTWWSVGRAASVFQFKSTLKYKRCFTNNYIDCMHTKIFGRFLCNLQYYFIIAIKHGFWGVDCSLNFVHLSWKSTTYIHNHWGTALELHFAAVPLLHRVVMPGVMIQY